MRGTVHPRWAPVLFSGMLSAIMVSIVTATLIVSEHGWTPEFLAHWQQRFSVAWPVAFPVAFIMGPKLRRMVKYLTSQSI